MASFVRSGNISSSVLGCGLLVAMLKIVCDDRGKENSHSHVLVQSDPLSPNFCSSTTLWILGPFCGSTLPMAVSLWHVPVRSRTLRNCDYRMVVSFLRGLRVGVAFGRIPTAALSAAWFAPWCDFDVRRRGGPPCMAAPVTSGMVAAICSSSGQLGY